MDNGTIAVNQILSIPTISPNANSDQIRADVVHAFPKIKGEHSREQDLANTNPNYNKGARYQSNCQKCVSAYEARRRGYNVQAKPYEGLASDTLVYDDLTVGWPSVYKNPQLLYCGGKNSEEVLENIESRMGPWKNGARAIVAVDYRFGDGHVFIAEKINDKVCFFDPQLPTKDVNTIWGMIKPQTVNILRIDNLEFTERINECCEVCQ